MREREISKGFSCVKEDSQTQRPCYCQTKVDFFPSSQAVGSRQLGASGRKVGRKVTGIPPRAGGRGRLRVSAGALSSAAFCSLTSCGPFCLPHISTALACCLKAASRVPAIGSCYDKDPILRVPPPASKGDLSLFLNSFVVLLNPKSQKKKHILEFKTHTVEHWRGWGLLSG